MAGKLEKEDQKTERVLRLWNILSKGRSITRSGAAELFHVNERTVSRYFVEIRKYLDTLSAEDGIQRSLSFDRKTREYTLTEAGNRYISNGELFGICKILIESRAFRKETLTSLMNRLLNTAVPPKDKKEIASYVKRELFDYENPAHKEPDMDNLWEVARTVAEQRYLSFGYQKIGADAPSPHRVKPLGLFFSEYYFYLTAFPAEGKEEIRCYRLDRMTDITPEEDHFSIAYASRFREGEFKNRVQYMFGGELEHVEFIYSGASLEAVLDRLPTAEAEPQKDGTWLVKAEVAGMGILMWLLSQGSRVNLKKPAALRKVWLEEARKICEME